jgi:hypothetical protein
MPNINKNKAKWTIMVYMAADDQSSYDAAVEFLAELEALGQELDERGGAAKVNILLQAYLDWQTEKGAEPMYEAKRFRVQSQFMLKPERYKAKNILMGSSNELANFIKWCKRKYKAERYMLLLWGHGTGSGMFSAEIQDAYTRLLKDAPDFTITDLITGRRVTIAEILRPDSSFFNNPENKARFSINYTNQNNLVVTDILTARKESSDIFKNKPKYVLEFNNPAIEERLKPYCESRSKLDGLIGRELNISLEKSFGKNGKLDLLVIMACCMQMVEFGYEIRKHCRFYATSEELMFFEGYNYFDTILDLIKRPGISPRNLGIKFIEQIPNKKDYNEADRDFMALSCVNLEKIDKIERGINDIAKQLYNNYERLDEVIRKTRLQCSHFGENSYRSSFIDIVWFLKKLNKNLAEKRLNRGLRRKIKSIRFALQKQYIIEEYIGERKKPKPEQDKSIGGHGVAIYFPSSEQDHLNDEDRGRYFNRNEKDYVNTFSKKNYWNNMIFEYMKRYRGDRSAPTFDFTDYVKVMNLLDENSRLIKVVRELV